jgi:hypothetical protein
MSGHGHVTTNPDGLKARCGGPEMCRGCQREATEKLTTVMDDILHAEPDTTGETMMLADWLRFKRRLVMAADPRRN